MGQKKSMLDLHRVSVEEYKEVKKLRVTVVLDNVRSEMNVGSVFRTADAFLIERIFLCGITPQPPKAEIHKTALGAEESVDWQYYPTTLDCINQLKEDVTASAASSRCMTASLFKTLLSIMSKKPPLSWATR